jgi:uncharacterized protein YdaU (DUF1376 family)
MAKQPYLPLYYNDISGSCASWSDEEFGCYIRLLMEQWRNGGIPIEPERIKRLITSFESSWPLLKSKFKEDAGVLKNKRMEEIRMEVNAFSEKQSQNIKKRWDKLAENKNSELPLQDKPEKETKPLDDITARELAFKQSLYPHVGELHPKERVKAFFEYWSEKTHGGKKMRFELQKTWEVKKRLATWARNEKEKIAGKSVAKKSKMEITLDALNNSLENNKQDGNQNSNQQSLNQ